MTRLELTQKYWKYYLLLEKKFLEFIEYVELHVDNSGAFSNGYALIMQAVGAELDTIFKEFCGYRTSDRKSINDYAQYILSHNQDIVNIKINLQEYDIEIQPFKNWSVNQPGQTLTWWIAFTSLKHNRFDCIKEANQLNVLNILGALYLMEMMLLKKITENSEELDVFDASSNLFTLKNWSSKAIPVGEAFAVLGDLMAGKNCDNRNFDA